MAGTGRTRREAAAAYGETREQCNRRLHLESQVARVKTPADRARAALEGLVAESRRTSKFPEATAAVTDLASQLRKLDCTTLADRRSARNRRDHLDAQIGRAHPGADALRLAFQGLLSEAMRTRTVDDQAVPALLALVGQLRPLPTPGYYTQSEAA